MDELDDKTLHEAASDYLVNSSLSGKEKQWLERFVKWAPNRVLNSIKPSEIESYGFTLPVNNSEIDEHVHTLRKFLFHVKKSRFTSDNLGQYLKIKKPRLKRPAIKRIIGKQFLSSEKLIQMEQELDLLKEQRIKVVDDVRRAAADKDLKENAPYHAAREEKSKLDGKILELESLIKHSVVCDSEIKSDYKVSMGSRVTLIHETSGKEICYTLVMAREVSALEKRISQVSPIGQAIMGHGLGETVDVQAPSGKVQYRIIRIE